MKKCGEVVTHLIAGASWFPCALEKGHDGPHRAGGTCVAHGEYLGEPGSPPHCPNFPTCATAILNNNAAACSPQESTCSGVESAGETCKQVLAWPDRTERGKCFMPAGHIGPHNFVDSVRPPAGDVLRDARPPFALGIRDRGNGHYSYAVLEAEGGLYVHCGTDREKAERIILALNARSRTVSLEAQLAKAEIALRNADRLVEEAAARIVQRASCTCSEEGSGRCKFPHPCSRCHSYHPGISCYWHAHGKTLADRRVARRTFLRSDNSLGCAECCSGDRCDDPTHYDRDSCPYCMGSGTPKQEAGKGDKC